MSLISWLIGVLFLVIGISTSLSFSYLLANQSQLYFLNGSDGGWVGLAITFALLCALPFLLSLFFMLLPGYVKKHAGNLNTATFD